MIILTGTSGYGYRQWKGKFYPGNISAGEMLRFYSARLKTVEINNTFYRMPKESILNNWAEQVPGDFVFAIKAPQIITHVKQLRNVRIETEHFFGLLAALGSKAGPVLFQMPRSFTVDHDVLAQFLDLVKGRMPCAFEFRHDSWFQEPILDMLREKECSLCIADTDDRPVERIQATANWGYLRLRRSDYTDRSLTAWAERILAEQWKSAFVFFKHEDEAKGPQLAMRFMELLDRDSRAAH